MTVALVIFGATLQLLAVTANKQISVQTRVSQLSQPTGRRGASRSRSAPGIGIAPRVGYFEHFNYYEPAAGSAQAVSFSCSAGRCTRTVSGVPQTAITNVANTDVFTRWPATGLASYVGVKLVISAPGHTSVTLSDGVNLRNAPPGQ